MATRRAFNRYLKDKDLQVVRALPGVASTVHSTGIDTQVKTAFGIVPPGVEALIEVPALTTTQLPDTKTLTVTIEASDDVAFGSGVDTLATLVLTGAGGVGTPAGEVRVSLSPNAKRYIRGTFVTGAASGDCSGSNGTISLVI